MKRCLIYLDVKQKQNSIDLLEVVQQVYKDDKVETYCVAINNSFREGIGLFDQIITVTDRAVSDYDVMAVGDVMIELQAQWSFDCILVPGSSFGRMLAPRVAMALKVGLVADVTAINLHDGMVEMIRPAYSGRLLAGISGSKGGPIMMSIRQGVFQYHGLGDKKTVLTSYKPVSVRSGGIKALSVKEKDLSYDIRESDVLISGGGGVLRDFNKLNTLAENLNGCVSASRQIVDKGVAPRSIQVGQSGKTVSPKLYIAIGIFGAIQHVEGLKNVKNIISVNTNRFAPICSLSDIVVEGDAVEFIEKLNAKIETNKNQLK